MEALSLAVVAALLLFSFGYASWPLFHVAPSSADPSGGGDTLRESEVARLLVERENAYKQIAEIDLDRQMGKLSDEDYAEMMGAARDRALGILRRLEGRGVYEGAVSVRLESHEAEEAAHQVATQGDRPAVSEQDEVRQSLDEKLEAEVLRYRKAAPEPPDAAPPVEDAQSRDTYCPFCGDAVEAGHNFCASCGEKLL